MSLRTADRPDRRGAVLVLVALLLILLVALLAFAVDVGLICLGDAHLQNAADAAALAGALELRCDCDAQAAAARRAAIDYAARNDAVGDPVAVQPGDVQLGTWDDKAGTFAPLAGAAERKANAVRVTCRRTAARGNPLRLAFAAALGRSSVDLVATATARVKSSRCGLIVGIESAALAGGSDTDSYDSSAGPYRKHAGGSDGDVCSNGNITTRGGSRINGDAHPGVGKTVTSTGGSRVTGTTRPLTTPMLYPPVDLGTAATKNDNGKIPPTSRGNAVPDRNGRLALSSNEKLLLPPGTYYFSDLKLSGGADLLISGQTTIFVTGDVDISGGTATNPTLRPINLQLYVLGDSVDLSGGADFHGVVYAPAADVVRRGGSDLYGSVVGRTLELGGGHGVHADTSLDLAALKSGVQSVALVE